MKWLSLLSTEFSKLTANKGILLSVIAAMLVPVVYGGILLSATWGPYDNLSNLPVAVVNDDQGAVLNGNAVHVGEELVNKLREGEAVGWRFVDSGQAMRGLENNEYYMVIRIPKDFSEKVTTVMEPNPQKLKLEYIQNEGLNFLASQVTKTAAERIREQLANTITEQYTATVFSGLEDAAGGIKKASDGSAKLADGTSQLHEGTEKLNESVSGKSGDIAKLADGAGQLKAGTGQLAETLAAKQGDITKLAEGTKQLKNGTGVLLDNLNNSAADIEKLAKGSKKLKDGTGQVLAGLQKAEAGSKSLSDGVRDRLVPGSRKVADGTGKLKEGSAKLADGAARLVAGLEEYRKANPTVNVGPYYQQIVDGAKEISSGLSSMSAKSVALNEGAIKVADGAENTLQPGTAALHDGISQLAAGQEKVDLGAAQLAAGNDKVNSGWTSLISGVTKLDAGAAKISNGNEAVDEGWKKLSSGATKIDDGMGKVSSGTSSVNEGWKKLADGTSKLNDGAGKVNEGSEKLSDGLKNGAEKMEGVHAGKENVQMFASPVELEGKKINGYEHYRDSTAPYVLTIGLFAGILILSLFLKFDKPPFVTRTNWFVVKFLQLGALSIVQAVMMLIVAFVILGVQVTNPAALILFTITASLTFAAIVLFLASFGGNVGRLAALALAVLQLSTTGANLPVEMLPENLRDLSEVLPFTYSILGFRSVLTLNDFSGAAANMGVIALYFALFASLSLVVFLFKGRTHKEYQEKKQTAAH
ncbi:YhgE/Pip family protein [Fictibacillus iocasae]|uniref:YhgE/Pip family protein n=1 Tax=Fictibacillus iocasae TaxID=2715437 RepID=A0ABW2NUM2_9BACL